MLLTFRPFLVFRGHWQRERNIALNQSTTNVTNRPRETPSWLNEACNHAITAAQRTLHHLCEASRVNNLVLVNRPHVVIKASTNNLIGIAIPWVLFRQFCIYSHLRVHSQPECCASLSTVGLCFIANIVNHASWGPDCKLNFSHADCASQHQSIIRMGASISNNWG